MKLTKINSEAVNENKETSLKLTKINSEELQSTDVVFVTRNGIRFKTRLR